MGRQLGAPDWLLPPFLCGIITPRAAFVVSGLSCRSRLLQAVILGTDGKRTEGRFPAHDLALPGEALEHEEDTDTAGSGSPPWECEISGHAVRRARADGVVGPVQVCPGGSWWARGLNLQCPSRQAAHVLLSPHPGFHMVKKSRDSREVLAQEAAGPGGHPRCQHQLIHKQVCSSDVTCRVCALGWTRTQPARPLPGSLLVGGVLGHGGCRVVGFSVFF